LKDLNEDEANNLISTRK